MDQLFGPRINGHPEKSSTNIGNLQRNPCVTFKNVTKNMQP